MRICFTTIGLSFGGAERVITILANKLVQYGHEVSIIILNEDRTIAYPLSREVNVVYMQSARFDRIGNLTKLVLTLRRHIHELKPEVLLSFFNTTFTFTWLSTVGMDIPLIFSERNDPNSVSGIKNRLFQFIALNASSAIVFQTNGAKEYYKHKYDKKSHVVLNPVSPDIIDKKEQFNKRRKEIVSIGRLSEQKNHRLLIEAFSTISDSYKDYKLIIYGEGVLRSDLEKLITDMNLCDRVLLPGTKTDVIDRIRSSALFVLSSKYEGLPNALIEAMALGIPCISTDCSPGGARELIQNHENGIIVPVNDVNQLAEAIKDVLDNPISAEIMGNNAKLIVNRLNEDTIAKDWESIIIDPNL